MASWTDLECWCSAMLHTLDPWEKKTLLQLSQLRASVSAEEITKENKTGKKS